MTNFNMNKDEICRVAGWGEYAPKNSRFFKCFKEANAKTGITIHQFEELYPIIHVQPCEKFAHDNEMVELINEAMNQLSHEWTTPSDLISKSKGFELRGYCYSRYHSGNYCRDRFADFVYAYSMANPNRMEMLEVSTCGKVAIRAYRLK